MCWLIERGYYIFSHVFIFYFRGLENTWLFYSVLNNFLLCSTLNEMKGKNFLLSLFF